MPRITAAGNASPCSHRPSPADTETIGPTMAAIANKAEKSKTLATAVVVADSASGTPDLVARKVRANSPNLSGAT